MRDVMAGRCDVPHSDAFADVPRVADVPSRSDGHGHGFDRRVARMAQRNTRVGLAVSCGLETRDKILAGDAERAGSIADILSELTSSLHDPQRYHGAAREVSI